MAKLQWCVEMKLGKLRKLQEWNQQAILVVLDENLDHALRTWIAEKFETIQGIVDLVPLSDQWLDVNLASSNELDGQWVTVERLVISYQIKISIAKTYSSLMRHTPKRSTSRIAAELSGTRLVGAPRPTIATRPPLLVA